MSAADTPRPDDDAPRPADRPAAGTADEVRGMEEFDPRAMIERMRADYWKSLAAPPAEDPGTIQVVVTFDVGEGFYAVAVDAVREVLKMPWIARLPRTPEFLLGVVNVRGRILPVLDLRQILAHTGRPADRDARLVSVRHAEAELCLRVDRVHGLAEVAADDIQPAPTLAAGVPRDLLAGQVDVAGRLLAVIDVPALLRHCAEQIGGTE